MDLDHDVVYRGFTLNKADIRQSIVAGSGVGSGISGCVIDSVDYSDVDIVQFLEKRSEQDGMDAGQPFYGSSRIRMSGTLYGLTRALLYDDYWSLRKALSATLAHAESPADKGYRPLLFSVPTNRVDDYPAGAIDLRMLAMPRSKQLVWQKDQQGGDDGSALAIPWQAIFICKDPQVTAQTALDFSLTASTLVTGVTGVASTDVFTKTAHGLVAGDRIYFTAVTGGSGLAVSTGYYVIASGLTANAFKLSLTSGGSSINFTTDISAATYVKVRTDSGTISNRGTDYGRINMLIEVGATGGTIAVTVGGVTFTITVPASTGNRILQYDGKEKTLNVVEGSASGVKIGWLTYSAVNTYPAIPEGVSAYALTYVGVTIVAGSHIWTYEPYA